MQTEERKFKPLGSYGDGKDDAPLFPRINCDSTRMVLKGQNCVHALSFNLLIHHKAFDYPDNRPRQNHFPLTQGQ